MTELVDALIANAVERAQTGPLIEKLLELPQAACNVRHIFGPSIYMRELSCPKGTVIVGRAHRLEHDCILVKGALSFFNADGTQTSKRAIEEFRASPGRKIARVDEDLVFVNTWAIDCQDVELLEREIFEDEAPPDDRPMLERDGDFEAMLKEQGASLAEIDRASFAMDDVGPFPYGAYKVRVARSRIHGSGLVACADIAAGEFIAPGTWGGKRTPAGRYTNHAKDPNASFLYGADGIAWLVASTPIVGSRGGYLGDEVTIDYRRTPRRRWEELS